MRKSSLTTTKSWRSCFQLLQTYRTCLRKIALIAGRLKPDRGTIGTRPSRLKMRGKNAQRSRRKSCRTLYQWKVQTIQIKPDRILWKEQLFMMLSRHHLTSRPLRRQWMRGP